MKNFQLLPLLGFCVLGVGLGNLFFGNVSGAEPEAPGPVTVAMIEGEWELVAGLKSGKAILPEKTKGKVNITAETITLEHEAGRFVMEYKLQGSEVPTKIDLKIIDSSAGSGQAEVKGLIRITKSGQLQIGYRVTPKEKGEEYPPRLESTESSGLSVFRFKRKLAEEKSTP
jgi:uncharacterized protein (TIGR03067 family)